MFYRRNVLFSSIKTEIGPVICTALREEQSYLLPTLELAPGPIPDMGIRPNQALECDGIKQIARLS
jgi:hypothetical protein